MRVRGILIFISSFIILFTSCSKVDNYISSTSKTSQVYDDYKYNSSKPISLKVNLNNSDLKIVSWEKKEINVEVKHSASGFYVEDYLKKFIKDNGISINMQDEILNIENKASKNKDILFKTEILIHSPADFNRIEIVMDDGTFKSEGDLQGNGKINLSNGSIEIGRFTGAINAEAFEGDISLKSGRLKEKSSFKAIKGNITVKTDLESKNEYLFNSENGHISIYLPSKLSPKINTVGIVKANDFTLKKTDGPIIYANAKYGTIDIKKF